MDTINNAAASWFAGYTDYLRDVVGAAGQAEQVLPAPARRSKGRCVCTPRPRTRQNAGAPCGDECSIDWLGVPRLDSPACFAALLGSSRAAVKGGRTAALLLSTQRPIRG